MRFTKMHGAGNDYVYVDARGQERDWPALSVAMSDRHLGVGSDGLILALPSEKADLRMRMFNADGSEGEMCGNGIRCLVSFAFDNGIVAPEKSPVLVETMAGVLDVSPLREDGQGMVGARVLMGEPRLNPPDVPVAIEGMDAVNRRAAEGRRARVPHDLRVDGKSARGGVHGRAGGRFPADGDRADRWSIIRCFLRG